MTKVYQADPATCIRVSRKTLDEALELMRERGQTSSEVYALVHSARMWLPSWLMSEWDEQMAAWMEREGAPQVHPAATWLTRWLTWPNRINYWVANRIKSFRR